MAEFDYEVVNGRKIRVRPQEVVSEIDENGYFVRQPNHFTEGFGEGKNPVEKGRYHLVWAKLCHWSNRASIVRELLGLEDAISVNMVDHAKHEKNLGWESFYFWMSRHLHWIRSLSEKFWIRSKKRQMKDIQCFWCPMR